MHVEVRIYTLTGNLLHDAVLTSPPPIIRGQYAYEYTWDTSRVASGVYLCSATAKKSGEKNIRVLRKIAVVK